VRAQAKILIIDDDGPVRGLVRTLLEREGHAVAEACDGQAGVRALYAGRPDLVLLDVCMPGMDGWGALERIRELSDVPVLMMSALSAEADRVRGLAGGADDYVTKPFSAPELVARVTAVLRRTRGREVLDVLDDGWARVDGSRHEAVVDGVRLSLTPLEFRLLGTFLRHTGVALTHDQLLEHAWPDQHGSREQVKVAVLGLRRKLAAAAPGAEDAVQTIRGIGYRWSGPVGVAA
jgi:DNA-binding response OmpR family regulator